MTHYSLFALEGSVATSPEALQRCQNAFLDGRNPSGFSVLPCGKRHQGKWKPKVHLVEQKTRFDRGSQGLGFDHRIKSGSKRQQYIKRFGHC